MTVSVLPTDTPAALYLADSVQVSEEQKLAKRVDPYPLPLPDVDDQTPEFQAYLSEMAKRLTQVNGWLPYPEDVSALWSPFLQGFMVFGVKGLWGCTAVVITSAQGVYLAHIYEVPVFLQEEDEYLEERDEASFRSMTITALTSQDESPHIDSLFYGRGTDERRGPLHAAYNPHVTVITPFEIGDRTLKYHSQARMIGDSLTSFLYPGGVPEGFGAILVGYDRVHPETSDDDNSPWGKAILEYTPIQEFMEAEGTDKKVAVRRWRLSVAGKIVVSHKFWEDNETTEKHSRRDGIFEAICRPPEKTQYCGPGTCGNTCGVGKGDFATVAPIDCAALPTITVTADKAPLETRDSSSLSGLGVAYEHNHLAKRVDPIPLPDMDYDTNNPGTRQYLQHLSAMLTQNNHWYFAGLELSSEFMFWPDVPYHLVYGIRPLAGCVAAVIVSDKGLYIAWITEFPWFVNQYTGEVRKKKWFEENVIDRLMNPNPGDPIRPFAPLVGTDENPGPLHKKHSPNVYVISPRSNSPSDPLDVLDIQYQQARNLATAFSKASFGYRKNNLVMNIPYEKPEPRQASLDDRELGGRAFIEFTPLENCVERIIRRERKIELQGISRMRLWVNGFHAATRDHLYGILDSAAVSFVYRNTLGEPAPLCPIPGFTASSTPVLTPSPTPLITSSSSVVSTSSTPVLTSSSSVGLSTSGMVTPTSMVIPSSSASAISSSSGISSSSSGISSSSSGISSSSSGVHSSSWALSSSSITSSSLGTSSSSPGAGSSSSAAVSSSSVQVTTSSSTPISSPSSTPTGITLPFDDDKIMDFKCEEISSEIGFPSTIEKYTRRVASACTQGVIKPFQMAMHEGLPPIEWEFEAPYPYLPEKYTLQYQAKISWVDGCVTPGDQSLNPAFPMEKLQCDNIVSLLFYGVFSENRVCHTPLNRMGRVSVEVSCLKYEVDRHMLESN